MRRLVPIACSLLLLVACAADRPTPREPAASTAHGAQPRARASECRGNESCRRGEFCDTAPNCGPGAPGRCAPIPEMCAKIYAPVEACDGKRYGNACEANSQGVSAKRRVEP